MGDYKRADGSRRICRCECGGWVRGVEQFGRLFTWCTKCTPVVKMTPPVFEIAGPGYYKSKAPVARS